MIMPDIVKRWTRAELSALPDDGKRYELLDGELLVTPSPRVVHQLAVWALYDRVAAYVRRHRLGLPGLAPADLDLQSGESLQPDLFVVPLRDGRIPLDWPHFGIPLLVVEVLSQASALNDRTRKRRRYQAARVGEYWIVDPDARVIERWRPDDQRPEILAELIEWQPTPVVEPLELKLTVYFKEVWGESM
jgi:Uma2 family endonuclease